MLKLIALNYTVMLNDDSQWLNIREKNNNFLGTSLIGFSDTRFSHKKRCYQTNIKHILSLCCFYINSKIECEIIAIQKFI